MKKQTFILAAFLLVAATTITIASCKKDKQEEKVVDKEFFVENDQTENMDEYLMAFKQKMLTAQKGDETLSLELARQNLCNLLNFDFGDANYATDIFEFDTIYVKLSLTEGVVELSQLAETYNKAFGLIRESYYSNNLLDKSVCSIICEYSDTGNKETDVEEIRIIVCYRGYIGNRANTHDTLSWHPRRSGGSCDVSGIYIGGAAVMELWLDDVQPILGCPNGGRLYFTEESQWVKVGYTTYDITEDRFKIFTEFTYQIDTVCISHEDMEYYYTNILNYYNQEVTNIQNTHVITNVYVDIACIPYSQPNVNGYPGDCWYWRIFINHGKPNCSGTNPNI